MLLLALHSESPRPNVTGTHSSESWLAPMRLCKYLALLETSCPQDALWLTPICSPVPVDIKRTIVLRILGKVWPSGDEREKQWLWLVFLSVIMKERGGWRDTNQQLNRDKHHQLQNVYDFNLTAELHTFVWRVCLARVKGHHAAFTVPRHVGLCSPLFTFFFFFKKKISAASFHRLWCHKQITL